MATYTLTVTDRGDVASVAGGGVASVVVSDGTSGGTTGSVTSVNGYVGVVNLTATDVGADASGAAAAALVTAEAYTDTAVAGVSGGGVASVNGLTGTVVLAAADVGAATTAQGATADTAVQPGTLAPVATAGTYASLTGQPTLGDAAAKNVGSSAGTVAAGDDSRLTGAAQKASNLGDLASASSARTNLGLGTSAVVDVPATGDAGIGQVVKGTDTRLTDARTPTSHTHPASQVSDSTTVGRAVVTAVDAAAARTAIGAGTSSLAIGVTGTTAAAGNDSRLSDARTPTAHAASHASAGSDPLTLAESQVTNLTTDLAAKVPKSTVTTKGDLIVGTASATVARQAAGSDGQVLAADSTQTNGVVYVNPGSMRIINAQVGTSYTTVLGDAGKFVTMTNAAASTLTIPPNSSVAYVVGTVIEGAQLGAGQVTLTPGAGVTINGTPGLKVAAQYGTFALLKTATDTWLAMGRLSA